MPGKMQRPSDVRQPTERDHVQFAISTATSNFNAVITMAVILSRAGLVQADDVKALHEAMSEPFDMPGVADNPLVAVQQARIDGVLREIEQFLARRHR